MAHDTSASNALAELDDFAAQLSERPTQFLDTKAGLAAFRSQILAIIKTAYDAQGRAPLRAAEEKSAAKRAHKNPLGPIASLLVDGFDVEQIWEQIAMRNAPLASLLDKRVKELSDFAVDQLRTYRQAADEDEDEDEDKDEDEDEDENEDDAAGQLSSDSDEGGPLEHAFFPFIDDDSAAEEDDEELSDEDEELSDEDEELSDEDEELSSGDDDGSEEDEKATKRRRKPEFNPDDPFDPEELARFLAVTDQMDAEQFSKQSSKGADSDDEKEYDSDEAAADALLYGKAANSSKGRTPLDLRHGDDYDDDEELDLDDDDDDDDDDDEEDGFSEGADDDDDDDDIGRNEEMMTRFLREEEQRRKEIEKLELKSIAKKDWPMRGEIEGTQRPENSLLEVDVEFENATEPAPLITTEYTTKLEEIITRRIIEQRFDDVVRKSKAEIEQAKKPRVLPELQDTQSQLGLAEEYEKNFMEQAGKWQKVDKAEELRKELAANFRHICEKLDALANFNYTPKLPSNEEVSVPNAPALQIEEVAPVGMSDAALLAPEEVFAPMKGSAEVGANELSHEERRARHQARKRLRAKELRKEAVDKKTVDKLNPGLGNKHTKAKALDQLAHSRNVDIGKEGVSSVTGSSALFRQLQEEAASIAKQLSSMDADDGDLPKLKQRYAKKNKTAAPSVRHKM